MPGAINSERGQCTRILHNMVLAAHLRMKRGSSVRTRADMTADPPASKTPRGIRLKGPMTSLYTCSSDSPCKDPKINALRHIARVGRR